MNVTSLRIGGELRRDLELRVGGNHGEGLSSTLARDGLRYYFLLRQACKRLAGQFDAAELASIADACGTWYCGDRPESPQYLIVELESYLPDSTSDAHLCTPALLNRVRALSQLEVTALVDATERFWRQAGTPGSYGVGEMLEDVVDVADEVASAVATQHDATQRDGFSRFGGGQGHAYARWLGSRLLIAWSPEETADPAQLSWRWAGRCPCSLASRWKRALG